MAVCDFSVIKPNIFIVETLTGQELFLGKVADMNESCMLPTHGGMEDGPFFSTSWVDNSSNLNSKVQHIIIVK